MAGRRLMFLGEEPAFELSFWCGTCQLLFRRLEGANETLSLESMQQRLNDGLHDIDPDVVAEFGTLLAKGDFLPMLLEVRPKLVRPSDPNDYLAHEQVATWGLDAFWGLPVYPSSSYYRTYTTAVDASAHLYEFVVPIVPPAWSDRSRVSAYIEALSSSALPTAVAVSILDICAPASGPSTDDYTHWGLTHFLLDGHHKMQAAADSNRALRLLTFLSIDGSLADEDSIRRLPDIRRRPPITRAERNEGRSARFRVGSVQIDVPELLPDLLPTLRTFAATHPNSSVPASPRSALVNASASVLASRSRYRRSNSSSSRRRRWSRGPEHDPSSHPGSRDRTGSSPPGPSCQRTIVPRHAAGTHVPARLEGP